MSGGYVGRPPVADPWAQFPDEEQYVAAQAATKAAQELPHNDPWAQFPDAPEQDYGPPPPGMIIHDKNYSYSTDDSHINVRRSNSGDKATSDAELGALTKRIELNATAPNKQAVARGFMPYTQGGTLGFADEAMSLASGVEAALKGGSFSKEYDMRQELYRQELERERQEHPWRSTLTQIGGTAPLAIAAAPASLSNAAATSGTLMRVGAAAGDGAIMGGIAGAGEAKDGERIEGGYIGAGTGAVIGAAAYPIAAGVGAAINKGAGWLAARKAANEIGVSTGAAQRVARAAADDGLNAQKLAQQADELGPEGMLMDASPNLQGQASAIASLPGVGQKKIVDAVTQRSEGASGRITNTIDETMGPASNRVKTPAEIEKTYADRADPLWKQFRETPVPYTPKVESVINRIRLRPDILRKARTITDLDEASGQQQFFANIADDGKVTITRVPNAAELQNIKLALDDFAAGGGNEARVFGNVARELRGAVDDALSPGNPAGSAWAQARNASGEGFSVKEAYEAGGNIFKDNVSPEAVSQTLSSLEGAALAAYQQNARNAFGQVMGTARNDAGAARGLLAKGWNEEKLVQVLGKQHADKVMKRIKAEEAFQTAKNKATGNSETARRTAAQKEFSPSDRESVGIIRRADQALGRGYDWLKKGHDARVYNRIGSEAADLLTMHPTSPRVQALVNLGERQAQIAANTTPRDFTRALLTAPTVDPNVQKKLGSRLLAVSPFQR